MLFGRVLWSGARVSAQVETSCLRVLYQRIERTLVKSLHSGDPDVMAFALCTCCAILVKALEATFELVLSVKSMCHMPHTHMPRRDSVKQDQYLAS